jgi:hypothetical protein
MFIEMFIVFAEMFIEMFTENHVNIYVSRTWAIFGFGAFLRGPRLRSFYFEGLRSVWLHKTVTAPPPPWGSGGPLFYPPALAHVNEQTLLCFSAPLKAFGLPRGK